MPPKFETNALASQLVNAAQEAAIAGTALEGASVTDSSLRALARAVKAAILAQAQLGQWAELGVDDPQQLAPLVVIARRGRGLSEPPIVLRYDWSKTDLKVLLVEQTNRKRSN